MADTSAWKPVDETAWKPVAESPQVKQEPQPGAFAKFFHAVNEFSNPLAAFEPTPGLPFDEKLKPVLSALAEIPHQMWKSLQASGEAMRKGEVSKAAYHLAGAVPLLGPMSQQVAQDVENRAPAEALGHAVGMGGTAAMANPEAAGAAAADTARATAAAPTKAVRMARNGMAAIPEEALVHGGATAGAAAGGFVGGPVGAVVGAAAGGGAGKLLARVRPKLAEAIPEVTPISLENAGRTLDEIARPVIEQHNAASDAAMAQWLREHPEEPIPPATSMPAAEPTIYEGLTREQLSHFMDHTPESVTVPEWKPVPEKPYVPDKIDLAKKAFRDRKNGVNDAGRAEAPAAPGSSREAPAAQPASQPVESNPIPEAFRSEDSTGVQIAPKVANRNAVASKIAEHFSKIGITSAEIDALEKANPEAFKLLWDNAGQIPGASKQKHYSPSSDTIAAARDALAEMEGGTRAAPVATEPVPAAKPPAALQNNPKALAAAQALAEELMRSEAPKVTPKKRGKKTIISGLLQDIRERNA